MMIRNPFWETAAIARWIGAAAVFMWIGSATATVYNVTYRIDGVADTRFYVDTTFNPLSTPAADEIVPAGQPYLLRWMPSNTQGVSFDLCQGTLTDFTRYSDSLYVGTNLPNTGSFSWAVDASLPSANNYLLVIQHGDFVVSTSPIFAIANLSPGVSSLIGLTSTTPISSASATSPGSTAVQSSTGSTLSLSLSTQPSSTTSDLQTCLTPASASATGYAALVCLIPSPVPNWQGLRIPDYNSMYKQYTIGLHCNGGASGFDYGVYGFYTWIEHLGSVASNFWTALTQDPNPIGRRAVFRILNGVIPFVVSMVRAGFLIRSLSTCRQEVSSIIQDEQVGTAYIFFCVTLGAWALSGSSGFLVAIDWNRRAAIVPSIAFVYIFLYPCMLYYGYTNFLYLDGTITRPILAVSIPLALLLVIVLIVAVFISSNNFRAGMGIALLALAICFYMWSVGMGRILLGRTTNDVWGSYAIRGVLNIVDLVLTTLLVPLGVVTAGLAVGQ